MPRARHRARGRQRRRQGKQRARQEPRLIGPPERTGPVQDDCRDAKDQARTRYREQGADCLRKLPPGTQARAAGRSVAPGRISGRPLRAPGRRPASSGASRRHLPPGVSPTSRSGASARLHRPEILGLSRHAPPGIVRWRPSLGFGSDIHYVGWFLTSSCAEYLRAVHDLGGHERLGGAAGYVGLSAAAAPATARRRSRSGGRSRGGACPGSPRTRRSGSRFGAGSAARGTA